MVLPKQARPSQFRQIDLFDLPIKGSKALAPLVGDLFNELVRVIVGGESLTTNGQIALCPDIFVREDASFIEVKASERSNYYKLARYQLNKYKNVYDVGRRVLYAFAVYSAGRNNRPVFKHLQVNEDGVRTISSALRFLAEHTQQLLIIDLEVLNACINRAAYIERWGKHDDQSDQVPEEHRGYYYFKVKDVDALCYNTVETLVKLGLDIADYEVTRTDVVGLQIADINVCRFPFVRISKKVKRAYDIDLNNVDWLRRQALEAFDSDQVEDEVPF